MFAVLGVFAQPKALQTFSLKQAVDYAIQNNNAAKNAKLGEQQAKARNWEILTVGLPQINASVEYDYYFKTPQVPALSKIFTDSSNSFVKILNHLSSTDPVIRNILSQSSSGNQNISFVLPHSISTGLTITQLLFDARYMFGIQARKELFLTSRLSSQLTEQDVKYTVTKAYYQAEAAQEAKAQLQKVLLPVDTLLTYTKAVYAQGLIEEVDVDRLTLIKITLESQINAQNQMAEVGLANLKFQMGLPLDDEIALTDRLDDLKTSVGIAEENKFDITQRVEYTMLNTAIKLKGYDVAQRRSGYYPSLAGFLNYGWNVQGQNFGDMFTRYNQVNADGSISKVSPWYQQGLVGLKLNIPIFDSGNKWASVQQAKIDAQKTKNDLENFKQAAALQYQAAQSSLNAAIADEVNSTKTVELSQKIFNKNKTKFNLGMGSSFELLQSEQDYVTNQLKHIQNVMNLLNAKADLDKALGIK